MKQVKQGLYNIYKICRQILYHQSIRLFKYDKYHILCTELNHSCHKHLNKNAIQFESVCNNMTLDSIPNELKNFHKSEKVLISKKLLILKNNNNVWKRQIF